MDQLFAFIKSSGFVILGLVFGLHQTNPAPEFFRQDATSSSSFATLRTIPSVDFPAPTLFSVFPQKPPKTPPTLDERKAVGEETLGKPVPHDFGSPYAIQTLPVNLTCPHRDLPYAKLKITRALLFGEFPDLNSQAYNDLRFRYPDIGTDAFLVFEGQGVNESPTEYISHEFQASEYFRIKRTNSLYDATGASGGLLPYSTRYFAAIIPVKPEEKQFTVLFCDFKAPIVISLNFSSPETKTMYGVYRERLGVKEGAR